MPRFLWRGRWFWGAWLLIFLLPFTSEEARLHFVGSRYFSNIYGQPWQDRWNWADDVATPRLSPLERALWLNVRHNEYYSYYSGQNSNPASTSAGYLFRKFPREKWLHSLALCQSLGWGPIDVSKQKTLITWGRQGERIDPKNAFYPLMLAKVFGDSGRAKERAEALERAASGTRYDDGTTNFKLVMLRTIRGAGVRTWSETWNILSRLNRDNGLSSNQLSSLLAQLSALSQRDLALASKRKSPVLVRSALKRSNELMRVSLLFQKAPCGSDKWGIGADWARAAWRVARPPKSYSSFPAPKVAEFISFAHTQGSGPNVRLAQKCAARMRLLAPLLKPSSGLASGAVFSTFEAIWAEGSHASGFGVLAFGAYLLGAWWVLAFIGWRAVGQESKTTERAIPAALVVGWTLLAFGVLLAMIVAWLQTPATARRGPPIGQAEVAFAFAIFSFCSPPFLLALWCAVRTVRRHRSELALPARAQLEMNLASMEVFILSRFSGAFVLCTLGLAVGIPLLWGYLRWHALSGYDWLRFLFPRISPRLIDPQLTSIDSPVTPAYCAMGIVVIALVWLVSWRYGTDPQRRPIYHDGLRGCKEAIGCAITLTVWVYMALLLACHFSGENFVHRFEAIGQRGEGALVRGF